MQLVKYMHIYVKPLKFVVYRCKHVIFTIFLVCSGQFFVVGVCKYQLKYDVI